MSQYTVLKDFIENRMQMSAIYQPVMLIELLTNDGVATVTQIAKSILSRDQSQIEYYENITKRMVGEVLVEKRGLAEKVRGGRKITGYRLKDADSLSDIQVHQLVDLCLDKIDEFVKERGAAIWDHRRKSIGYVSGTLRYEVLKNARFRCLLCGTSAEEKALEVDHIVPRNMGGSDDMSNLQALCYSCNSMKRDTDDEDFRGVAKSYGERLDGCLFCVMKATELQDENELCYARKDSYPVTQGHTLIIPKRHVVDYFDLYDSEINAIHQMLHKMRNRMMKDDATVTAFNVGVNAGKAAGQSILHVHVHLIPRRRGDIENPRGGVRGVIPNKQKY